MADANFIAQTNNGLDNAGQILPYRKVNLLREAAIGDLSTVADGTAEGPNATGSLYDITTTLGKILTRRYKGKDVFDMVATLYQAHLDATTPTVTPTPPAS